MGEGAEAVSAWNVWFAAVIALTAIAYTATGLLNRPRYILMPPGEAGQILVSRPDGKPEWITP